MSPITERTMMNLFLFLLLITSPVYAGFASKKAVKPKQAQAEQELPQCAICLDAINTADKKVPTRTLSCNPKHIFHTSCITPWLKKASSCPLCKKRFPNFTQEFLRAVEDGNFFKAQKCIRYIFDIDTIRDDEGNHVLYIAAGHVDDNDALVELLLKEGKADPNACSEHGETALQEAACNDNPNVIRMLYAYGADMDKQTQFGDTALHFAASRGHLGALDALIDCQADTEIPNNEGKTAWDKATRSAKAFLKSAQEANR